MKQKFQQWLFMLNSREKVMVIGGFILVMAMLLWGLVYDPMKKQGVKLNSQITERTHELRWMQLSSQRIKQAKSNPSSQRKPVSSGKSPRLVIDSALQRFQLKGGLKQMRSSGSKEVKVNLQKIQADKLMKFLGVLEMKHGIRVLSMDITPEDENGSISVNLKLGAS